MKSTEKQLSALWRKVGFEPDRNQKNAILHVDGPLYLPAGPGAGKTRVLLWRTLNLILFHEVRPGQIFLATFTEKAALQLRDGLRGLIGAASVNSGSHFDISNMYVGTVHSLCRRLIEDRRLSPNRIRMRSPALLDDLDQLLHIYKTSRWNDLIAAAGLQTGVTNSVNTLFGRDSSSRFEAAANCISFFNRLSEECVNPAKVRRKTLDEGCNMLLDLYEAYLRLLREHTNPPMTDFSLLQQDALNVVEQSSSSKSVFRHIIVDEYQDTNAVQERLFFKLAEGEKNLCVVGDDDQSLYRFRGATVQNFVDFPARCKRNLKQHPTTIPLGTNYRSRSQIVEFCADFITRCDWKKPGQRNTFYRVINKDISAKSLDRGISVLASKEGNPDEVCAEIARLVRDLIDQGKVTDPNQIAFLFPSLKSPHTKRLMDALENEGLKVYAPRAGRFLETEEALAIFGICLQLFDKPSHGAFGGQYGAFHDWIDAAWKRGEQLLKSDADLRKYVAALRAQIVTAIFDYDLLVQLASRRGWKLAGSCESPMRAELLRVSGLSPSARASLNSKTLDRLIELRQREGRPSALDYVINRVTSLDWNVLDLFYRLCEFKEVKAYIDSAENGADEGPICNLALISQYLARYLEGYNTFRC